MFGTWRVENRCVQMGLGLGDPDPSPDPTPLTVAKFRILNLIVVIKLIFFLKFSNCYKIWLFLSLWSSLITFPGSDVI